MLQRLLRIAPICNNKTLETRKHWKAFEHPDLLRRYAASLTLVKRALSEVMGYRTQIYSGQVIGSSMPDVGYDIIERILSSWWEYQVSLLYRNNRHCWIRDLFWDGLGNFEPWSDDEDDTFSPNFHWEPAHMWASFVFLAQQNSKNSCRQLGRSLLSGGTKRKENFNSLFPFPPFRPLIS
ncbi:hypothetical protein AVEN_60558-1 [Araneus ventricosus]|uniref:Uncharacterized protein n=1 Tax=Araneus ventricosus TaxID=182803 RepID=A0A4Y2EY85_ARAVE|nr:hypothetical protein AVEN_60558-1 [Araneus ventricosus]